MDRGLRTGSPVYVRQKSISSNSDDAPDVRSGSTGVGNFRRTQNYSSSHGSGGSIGLAAGRAMRSPSSSLGRNFPEHTPAVSSTSAGRPAIAAKPAPLVPPSKLLLKPHSSTPLVELPVDNRRDRRM